MNLNNIYYGVDILVNGKPVKIYTHEGNHFIEAKEGTEFEIKVINNSWGRVMTVASVDGLNVLDGEPASETDNGYVIDRQSSERIKGFRYSDEAVGAFKFTQKANSYSATKGQAGNVGGIGVRIYSEHIPLTYSHNATWNESWHSQSNSWPIMSSGYNATFNVNYSADCGQPRSSQKTSNVLRSYNMSAKQPEKGFDMGTTWGSAKLSKVVYTQFQRGSQVFSVDIYYASRESLLEMGVPLTSEAKVVMPSTFPGQYATPPKGWR